MCFKKVLVILAILALALFLCVQLFAMGGTADTKTEMKADNIDAVPASSITLKDLARIYWPDSDATQLQQEETLKNLLGKKVSWEITVAQIQREGSAYLIQGQSNKDMIGTFSLVQPRNKAEEEQILRAGMGSTLKIAGIVHDMNMRHIILDPAFIQNGD